MPSATNNFSTTFSHQPPPMPFTLPYSPYAPQQELMDKIYDCLDNIGGAATPSSSTSGQQQQQQPHHRLLAAELPTGTGKTLALLSGVLAWQAKVETLGTVFEQDSYFLQRCGCNYCTTEATKREQLAAKNGTKKKQSTMPNQRRGGRQRGNAADIPMDPQDAEWTAPELFFQQFRVTSDAKRLRVEGDKKSSSALRSSHLVPPCTVFYATRTHSQLHQVVRELRKFDDSWTSPGVKHNILASRAHYCVNRKLRSLIANKTLSVERNNLGEMCDKLVAVNQCEAVASFTQLASRTLIESIHHSHHQHRKGGVIIPYPHISRTPTIAYPLTQLRTPTIAYPLS